MDKPPRTIALLSDSTGNLGEYFVRALMSQFPKNAFRFRVYSFIKDSEELKLLFRELMPQNPIIFHTTVFGHMKESIRDLSKKNGCPEFDLTGGAMKFLEGAIQLQAHANLDALHELNQEYDQRIAAINYTVEHDDGLSGPTLEKADIVLMGISRTSKTPTSIYLANKGYKVANIPIVVGSAHHEMIKKYPRLRVVGLTIDPEKLIEVRQRRAEQENIPRSDYTNRSAIEEEIKTAMLFFLELGCPIINVTNHAVEETAALILKALEMR